MKKKNRKSKSNKYWLLGMSLFCILLMIFSVFAEKVEGPFRGVADITVIPMQKASVRSVHGSEMLVRILRQ